MKRRNFVYTGLALAPSALKVRAASVNDTIRAAVVGVNSRGMAHVETLLKLQKSGVQLAAICDPDRSVLESKAAAIEKSSKVKVDKETDLRRLYDRKDIDVVTIATPNHWHALATIWACNAGKDVYVEKPGSHNVFEGRKMIEAAHRNKRMVQHGVQLRSSPAIREAVDHLRNGTIGDVYLARGLCFRQRPSIGKKKPEKPPVDFDWDLWQGPAKERPFSRRYVHYNWHWHWDFGNGDIGNQGVHQTDMCLWGMGLTLPSEIQAMGGKFLFQDDKETPEVLAASFHYPEQNKMIEFEVRPWMTNGEAGVTVGNIFYGSKGYMVVNGYNSYEVVFEVDKKKPKAPGPKRKDGDPLQPHFENFLAAVRSRKQETLNGSVESAHYGSALAHLANISYRLGRRLNFDPKAEKFVGDSEADGHLTREYREPFVVK